MSDDLLRVDDASTPLSHEEREGLLLEHITLRSELNEAEQANIMKARAWMLSSRQRSLSTAFLNTLHEQMFCDVWAWAGVFRSTGKNIGVEAHLISTELRNLVEDCLTQIEFSAYEFDEIAARFHHRLVWIHAYPNGNGRHARLAADWLLMSQGYKQFSWGRSNILSAGEARTRYIKALRAADKHNYTPLLEFVRS